jgi:hypothetical protein
MISDYVVAHGVEVRHIVDAKAPKPHAVRAEAREVDGTLLYDRDTQTDLKLD